MKSNDPTPNDNLQLNELLRWLGLTAFEIFTALTCFLVFTVLVTLKVKVVQGRLRNLGMP